MIRILLLLIGSALLLASGRAEVLRAWYLDGNAVTDLEAETGQSTGGVGLQVGWRDTTIRVYDPDTPFGADELVAQQHRQSLDIHNHILMSFDNLFGTDNLQIATSAIHRIDSAMLWLYAEQAMSEILELEVRGLNSLDAPWTEEYATYNQRADGTPWSDGTFSDAVLPGGYGTYSTSVQTNGEWVALDVTAAMRAYQDALIGGIVLYSPDYSTAEIRQIHAYSNEHHESRLRPGLLVSLTVIPEPGTATLAMLGILALLFAVRRWRTACAAALLAVISLHGSGQLQAAQSTWISQGDSPAELRRVTRIEGDEISVDWAEGQVNPYVPDEPTGNREEIGVIRPRIAPPLSSVAILSFDDLFSPLADSLPRSVNVEEVTLWIYVTQTVGEQQVGIAGLHADDRDWDVHEASAQSKGTAEWNGGPVTAALRTEYGRFSSPGKKGWFEIPVNLARALEDFRAGEIGGLALYSTSEPTWSELCNFYFQAGPAANAARRPALLARTTPAVSAPTVLSRTLEYNEQTAQLTLRIKAPGADGVFLEGAWSRYSFGGEWSITLPPSYGLLPQTLHVTLFGSGGDTIAKLQRRTRSVPAFIAMDNTGRIELQWHSRSNAFYNIYRTDNLDAPDWIDVLSGTTIAGKERPSSFSDYPQASRGYYHVLGREYVWLDHDQE